MELLIAFWVVCGILGAIVGSQKNATGEGFILGLLFGPLGVIVAFAIDRRPKGPQVSAYTGHRFEERDDPANGFPARTARAAGRATGRLLHGKSSTSAATLADLRDDGIDLTEQVAFRCEPNAPARDDERDWLVEIFLSPGKDRGGQLAGRWFVPRAIREEVTLRLADAGASLKGVELRMKPAPLGSAVRLS